MARANFDACLKLILQFEGGYVDNPADPGGATNLGITRATLAAHRGRSVTKAEVKALQRDEAAEIYRASYWLAVHGDDLPEGVDAVVFDHAVNSGPGAAARSVRRIFGDTEAGPLGSALVAKIARENPENLIRKLCADRLVSLQRLSTFPTFGRGWTNRVHAAETAALKMCGAKRVQDKYLQNKSVQDKIAQDKNVPEKPLAAPTHANPPFLPATLESKMKLQGYRTFIIGFVLALAPAALQYFGAVDWSRLIGPTGAFFVSGLIAILMRAITTTAPGGKTEA